MADMNQNRIIASNLAYAYPDAHKNAVDGVTMRVKNGEFLAILGHNGSGKSTLAKLLNGLYTPTEGKVLVCGMDTADDNLIWDVRRSAGMVFQNPDNQLVASIVRDDVTFGLENTGVPAEEMPSRIEEALTQVGMLPFIDRGPHTLSGGQKQRIAIAGILAMLPQALILDESTAMLDPRGRREVFDTVERLNREKGITVIWITHFMEEAARCQRAIVMHEGKVAMDGTPQEVFSRGDELRKIRLDVPPMANLACLLRDKGVNVPQHVMDVEGMAREVLKCRS